MSMSRDEEHAERQARPESRPERLLRWQIVILLAGAALCYGSRKPWMPLPLLAWSLLSVVPVLLHRAEGRRASWSAYLPAFLFAVYTAISLLNPSHALALDGSRKPLEEYLWWLPTTIDPERTILRNAPWLAALLQGGSLLAMRRSRQAQTKLLEWIVGVCLGLSLLGALVWSTGAKDMLWSLKVPGGQFFATFIYKNHWVAFALPVACASLGLAFSLWDRGAATQRERNRRLWFFSAATLILATFPLPVSRSGTVMGALILLLAAAGIFRRLLRRSKGEAQKRLRVWLAAGAGAFVLVVVSGVVWLNWPSIEEGWRRSENEYTATMERDEWNPRVYSARDTMRMAADKPWFGWGGGSFFPVFPLYQGNYGRDPKTGVIVAKFEDAHCDWAQVLAEYGCVGLTLLLVPAVLCLVAVWRNGGTRGRWLFLGAVMILIYALAEFPFQNPVVLVQWAVLVACVAQEERVKKVRPQWH